MSAAVIPFPRELGENGDFPNSLDYSAAIEPALAGIASRHTRRAYETGMRQLLAWLGPRPLEAAAIREWIDHLADSGASAATINLRMAAAKRLCTLLEDSGRLDTTTASRIVRLKGRKRAGVRLGKWLTEPQVQKMLDQAVAASRWLDGAILALLYGCGLRREEAVGLEVPDLTRRDGQWLVSVRHGKGDKARSFAISDAAADLLNRWIAESGATAGPVLGVGVDAVYRHVQRMGELIGEDIEPHDLRRSCGRHIVDNGGSIEQVQLMYGHADVKTTRVYLNLEIDLKDPPAKRLRLRVGGANGAAERYGRNASGRHRNAGAGDGVAGAGGVGDSLRR